MVRACLWFVNMVLKLVDTDEEWLMVVNGSQSFMLVLDSRMIKDGWLGNPGGLKLGNSFTNRCSVVMEKLHRFKKLQVEAGKFH